MIMKKNLFYVVVAIGMLASCAESEYLGDQQLGKANENEVINFNMSTPAVTRAVGSEAATALGNRFVVWGEKNETDGTAATAANIVFQNYKVEYTASSAYQTTSNTKDWEYVGLTPYTDAQVSPAITGTQSIKYWDFSASSYTFTAVSALDADITDGKVVITKNTSGTTVYDKGYEIAIKEGASVDNIFVADRNQPTKGEFTDRTASNQYGGNVTMSFRNFMSKIRFGIYETIPGYKVKITKAYYYGSYSSTSFGVSGKFLTAGDKTTFTVSYEGSGSNENRVKATVKDGVTPNSQTYFVTPASPIMSVSEIGTEVTSPTYNKAEGAYTTILPFSGNDTNIKVKLDFTLTSEDTGETIEVSEATAEIPAVYCQWLPNYAYTYILKLNDNTNGQIGGVTGLYPITFDAIQITDATGNAEFITTISEPSITTFGVKSGAYSVGKSEYETGTDIYATIVKNNAVVDPTDNYKVYTVTAGATEAQVAEAVAEAAIRGVTPAVSCTEYTTNVSVVTEVPSEDGSTKTVTGAIKMENPAAATYAVAYKVSDGSASGETEAYDVTKTYYSTSADTTTGFYQVVTVNSEDLDNGAWKNDDAKAKYTTTPTQPVYVYKVIKVVAATGGGSGGGARIK